MAIDSNMKQIIESKFKEIIGRNLTEEELKKVYCDRSLIALEMIIDTLKYDKLTTRKAIEYLQTL